MLLPANTGGSGPGVVPEAGRADVRAPPPVPGWLMGAWIESCSDCTQWAADALTLQGAHLCSGPRPAHVLSACERQPPWETRPRMA